MKLFFSSTSFGVKIPRRIIYSACESCFSSTSSTSSPPLPSIVFFLTSSIYLFRKLIFDFWSFSCSSSEEFLRLSKESATSSATSFLTPLALPNLLSFFPYEDFCGEAAEPGSDLLISCLEGEALAYTWCGDPKSLNVSIYKLSAFGLSKSDLGLNSLPSETSIASSTSCDSSSWEKSSSLSITLPLYFYILF
jgi:hypothetical protein